MVFRVFKRIFDIMSASILFILLSPLYLLLMVMVKTDVGTPIYFLQERSGLKQKSFQLKKFRTMTNDLDKYGHLLPDEQRVTRLGGFLRSSSLDELPELLAIIKGDMSVIGPRPLPSTYNAYYSQRELKRFEVRSGLLPPDAIEFSAQISWDKQLECEAKYAESLSLMNDIRIFISALRLIVKRRQIEYGTYVRISLIEERSQNDLHKREN